MTMAEITQQVSFMLGLTASDNTEDISIEQAVLIAFRELSRYMKTPVDKTVPYTTRIDLKSVGIETKKILYVYAANPRIGLTLTSIDSGNVFAAAAAAKTFSALGQGSTAAIDPLMSQIALAQVRNVISSDFQWKFDVQNQVVYCTHKAPTPGSITIRYVPIYHDVSEIQDPTWIDYLVRMSEANAKKAIGRVRTKYTIQDSNVSLDGDRLIEEANAELEAIRQELEAKRRKLVVLN